MTGLDFNPANVAMAREIARERGLENVELVEGDARHTGLPTASFDLVHARTLLINVRKPEGVLEEMVRLARPGGVITAMEPDVPAAVCYPNLPEWAQLQDIFIQSFRRDGADPMIGRRLGELFRGAGLADVEVEARAEAFPPGYSRRTTRADLVRSMRPKIVERGIATEVELDDLDRAVRAHLDDPNTMIMQLMFVAWGRKPAA